MKIRKLGTQQLGKPLITTLNRASVVCCVDTEAFGAGVMLKAAWGHKPDTGQRTTGGLVEYLAMPWSSSVLPCTRTARDSCSMPVEFDAVV